MAELSKEEWIEFKDLLEQIIKKDVTGKVEHTINTLLEKGYQPQKSYSTGYEIKGNLNDNESVRLYVSDKITDIPQELHPMKIELDTKYTSPNQTVIPYETDITIHDLNGGGFQVTEKSGEPSRSLSGTGPRTIGPLKEASEDTRNYQFNGNGQLIYFNGKDRSGTQRNLKFSGHMVEISKDGQTIYQPIEKVYSIDDLRYDTRAEDIVDYPFLAEEHKRGK